jgi:hypothetical protein
MPFKYYAYTDEGLDGWVELSRAEQQKLEDCDFIARRAGYRWILYGHEFPIRALRHAPGRPAKYVVTDFVGQGEPSRLIRFDDGEVVEVRYVQEPPPFYEVGFHSPARV